MLMRCIWDRLTGLSPTGNPDARPTVKNPPPPRFYNESVLSLCVEFVCACLSVCARELSGHDG